MNLQDIKIGIEAISRRQNSSLEILPIWSLIMQEADKLNHFASQIVERALIQHQPISEKQAWVVAFFAKNNGLLTD